MTRAHNLHILSIGYEGASLPTFVATLKANRIRQLLDIREFPNSRRKGFSRTALSRALAKAGIVYAHERALGTPRWLRQRLREGRDYNAFRKDFRKHLAGQRKVLDGLAQTATGRMVLLCYERNPAECHRSIVAAALARRTGSPVDHLDVPRAGTKWPPRPSDDWRRRCSATSPRVTSVKRGASILANDERRTPDAAPATARAPAARTAAEKERRCAR